MGGEEEVGGEEGIRGEKEGDADYGEMVSGKGLKGVEWEGDWHERFENIGSIENWTENPIR